MERLKRFLTKLLFPCVAVLILLVPVCTALMVYAFATKSPILAVPYIAYSLSAYTLTLLCVRIPALCSRVKRIRRENKYAVRYFSDAALRVKISLYATFMLNTLYALMQLTLGIINSSIWFYTLSGYYFLLAVMRFFLLRNSCKERLGKNLYKEYVYYRLCGLILLMMNVTLSVIVFYIVSENRRFTHHYIVTIAMAAYTFTIFMIAFVNLVRSKKYNSPVMYASRMINLAAACVSMLSLETAMLTAFGEENDRIFRKTMTACTGAAVCVIVLAMAIYMLTRSTRKLHQIEKENTQNE